MLAVVLMLCSTAGTFHQPSLESSANDLIAVVNALRGAYGLPAYGVSPILMTTAQNQADYMAVTGTVTHSGPDGSTQTQRLLAAGYPLAGDLSLGGFRSENIIALAQSGSAQEAVNAWMGDAPHQYTMLSPDLTEIGAGVAVMNGRVYYVIDCARPTNGGAVSASTQATGAETTIPAAAAVIYPVVVSTPNANGEVIHEVRGGQTLWQIAISYGVKINDIKSRNNLSSNDIYPGDKLLIKLESTATTASPTSTVLSPATVTALPSPTSTGFVVPTMTQTSSTPVVQNNSQVTTVALGIVVLALVGGGVATWLSSSKRNPSA